MRLAQAAAKGAFATALTAFLVVRAAVAAYHAGGHSNGYGLARLGEIIVDPVGLATSAFAIEAAIIASASLTGMVCGVFAHRIIFARRTVLVMMSPFALWFITAATLFCLFAFGSGHPEVHPSLADVPGMIVSSGFYSLVGMMFVAPVALVPAVVCALVIERWTRPSALLNSVLPGTEMSAAVTA